MKKFTFKHFAANGRRVTACGLRIAPNTNANEKLHSNGLSTWHPSGEPTCKKCQKVRKSEKITDLVRCSEDDSLEALERAKAAHRRALALCTMLGKGWKPRIWYNFNWYHEASFKGIQVHGSERSYTAYFARIAVSGTSPRGCVRNLARALETAANEAEAFLCIVRKSLVLG